MKEVTYLELISLLERPLTSENIAGSDILLLKSDLQIPKGGGITIRRRQELKEKFFELGLPEGIISLPVQYCNGEYLDREDKPYLTQGLATVFHPKFFEGKVPMLQGVEPHRPLIDGYLDFRNESVLRDWIDPDTEDFDRSLEYHNGLWIGGLSEGNSKELVREHIKQFARLYQMRKFLREPERTLVDKSFIPYNI
jgi:hypothetical protein